jgi:cyclic pyranopterin phosphate synthase
MMIDITGKPPVYREAIASGKIKLKKETLILIKKGKIEKGDPIFSAKIAATFAAKNSSSLIPLCRPIPITNISSDFKINEDCTVEVQVKVKAKSKTGVEMEALVATTTALLTIWDMTKQYEKNSLGQYPHTIIQDIRILRKVKGKTNERNS